jgi:hypothetical protein
VEKLTLVQKFGHSISWFIDSIILGLWQGSTSWWDGMKTFHSWASNWVPQFPLRRTSHWPMDLPLDWISQNFHNFLIVPNKRTDQQCLGSRFLTYGSLADIQDPSYSTKQVLHILLLYYWGPNFSLSFLDKKYAYVY